MTYEYVIESGDISQLNEFLWIFFEVHTDNAVRF